MKASAAGRSRGLRALSKSLSLSIGRLAGGEDVRVPIVTRVFVLIVFLTFALTFFGHTIALALEYWDTNWFDIASLTSTVFIFFPTFGIVALVAFYLPATVLVDMYWRHAKSGRLRFAAGIVVIAALSYWISAELAAMNRGMYMIAPQTLISDAGEPAGCAASENGCARLPILDIVANVHTVSKSRFGLAEFVHPCETDPFLETPPANEHKRFCFASTPLPASAMSRPQLSTSADCCRAQELVREAISTWYAQTSQRSIAAQIYQPFMTLKVFFLFLALSINLLLVLHHHTLEKQYSPIMPQVEVCIIVATAAMLFYPFMYQGDIQTLDALYGTANRPIVRSLGPYLSFLFGTGALLVVLFFYRRHDKRVEQLGKMAGIAAGAVAVVKYDQVIAVVERVMGSGASWISFVTISLGSALCVAALAMGLATLHRRKNRGTSGTM
jgi:hypothetical protein